MSLENAVFGKKKKKNKYGRKKVEIDGITFDSKAEGEYYCVLKQAESIGALKVLDLQPKIYLTRARILYKPDFKIEENGEVYYVDVKGFRNAGNFPLKAKLWKFYGEGDLVIIKRKGKGFYESERIKVQSTS